MANPTTLVSTFDSSLDAVTPDATTTWVVDTGDEEYTATTPAQLELLSADSDVITIDPADVIDPVQGAIAFWFQRTADTGAYETLVECGVDGAGTDLLKVMITDADELVFWFNAEGDLPTYATTTETIAVDTMYFAYCEWTTSTMAVSLNNGPKVVAARAAVADSWGASDLKLEAV